MPSDDRSRRNPEEETRHSGNPNLVKILVLIKAAPLPSPKYLETVCTAGIDQNGNWYRLYPIPYRYLTAGKQFAKYQWIEIKVKAVDKRKDIRKESYHPILKTLRTVGRPLPTGKALERKQLILPRVNQSVESLQADFHRDGTSLGIIKPKTIINFLAKKGEFQWRGRKAQAQQQMRLFGPQPKELEKIPYDFYYKFLCNDRQCRKPHEFSIHDWEIYALYYSLKTRYGYAEDVILQKLREKWLIQMWDESKDSYLYLGTVHSRYKRPIYVVLGVFWPPK